MIKAGTYSVSSQIVQPSNVILWGEGRESTKLVSTSALASTMIRNSDQTNGNAYIGICYMTLDHSAATAGAAINYTKVSQSKLLFTYIKGNAFSFTVFWTGSTQADEDNVILGNILDGHPTATNDQFGGGRLTDSIIAFNTFKDGGGSGGCVQRLPLRCMIIGNAAYGQQSSGIALETAQYCTVVGNVCHDNSGSGIGMVQSADGDPVGCIIMGNVCNDNNDSASTVGRGIVINGTEHQIIGNRCSGNNGPGIEFTNNNCVVTNNICKNNGKLTSITDTFQVGIRATNANDSIVQGNRCYDDSTGSQLFGIYEIGTSDFNTITNNSVRGNTTAGLFITGANTICRANIGFKTEAKGTSSILSGTTSIAVTHGLSYTPAAGEITVTFTENPTTTPGMWWPTSIGATTFTVNIENNPGASNLDFSWSVRRI